MIIVAYFTETYIKWADVFLGSLKKSNGEKYKVILNTRNLTQKQINYLKFLYKNIEINNEQLTLEKLSKRHNVPIEDLRESREDCNNPKRKTGKFRLWMNIIADDDRINAFYNIVRNCKTDEIFLQMDIDIMIRDNLIVMEKEAVKYDVGLSSRWRGNIYTVNTNVPLDREDSMINIGVLTFKNNKNGIKFLKEWTDNINNIPVKNRKGKWGQTAIFRAFRELKDSGISYWRVGFQEDGKDAAWNTKLLTTFKTKNKNELYNKALEEIGKL